jgi:hypothetical protein
VLFNQKKFKYVFHLIKCSFKINELKYVIFLYPNDFGKEKQCDQIHNEPLNLMHTTYNKGFSKELKA